MPRNGTNSGDSNGRKRSHSPLGCQKRRNFNRIALGVVGTGPMGTGIVACLLAAGHPTTAVEAGVVMRRKVRGHLLALLKELKEGGLLDRDPFEAITGFNLSENYSALHGSEVIIAATNGSVEAKQRVIRHIERVASPEALIGINTSLIPVSILQRGALHPGRIVGIHWAEPTHVTRFMEIVCGKETQLDYGKLAMTLARRWGKEPSLLRREVHGFITNRIMYAMLREAFHLVESGYATPADVDRSLRNDLGSWITFAGPFRFMDLTGISAYEAVMRDLLPELSRETKVPSLITKLVNSGARGVSNGKGFYRYNPTQAKRWEKLFRRFSYEVRALAQRYPENLADKVVS